MFFIVIILIGIKIFNESTDSSINIGYSSNLDIFLRSSNMFDKIPFLNAL